MKDNNKSPLTDQEASALLLDYFKGFISEANRQRIDEWRASSVENSRKFDAVLELVMDVRSLDVLTSTDVEAALERVNARIIYERHAWIRNLERVAAVLAIPLLLATIWLSSHFDSREPIYCEMRTETGLIGRVVLPDGTEVTLNSGSVLRYPNEFTGETRPVELIGEGYFNVRKDPEHPFTVTMSDGNSVQVYGTQFNVEAYPGEDCVTTLVEGSVGFGYTDKNGKHRETHLIPDQQITRTTDGNVSIVGIKSTNATAWKNSEIILDSTSLKQILKTLERRFGVKFKVKKQNILSYTFSGGAISIKNLDYVLETLRISSGVNWQYITSTDDNCAIIELS